MSEPKRCPELSIVIPVRSEEANIRPLHAEIQAAFGTRAIEILFVDDGSRDHTFDEIKQCRALDPRVRGLRLRNHGGKSAAYAAGFRAARAPLIATLDGDLQDDPADLLKLEAALGSEFDLVVGWKQTGKSSKATFALSRLFNGLIRTLAKPKLHDMNCPVRVMRREVAESLELGADLHRYIPLMAAANGFRVREVPVQNRPRQHGVSKYSGSKYWSSAIALLGVLLYLRFGKRPMALFGGLGVLFFLIGFLVDAYYAALFVFRGQSIDDHFPTIMFGVALIVIGTQFLSLGLLAEILLRRLEAMSGRDSELAEEI